MVEVSECYYCRAMFRSKIVIKAASNALIPAMVLAINAAYKDYYIPIALSPARFKMLVEREGVQLGLSAVAVSARRVVGTGLLAVRGRRAWIGGMGVIPRFRRQGIARRLMQHLLKSAQEAQVETVQLEVLTENTPAISLYHSFGFETKRDLSVVRCQANELRCLAKMQQLEVTHLKSRELLPILKSASTCNKPWQRQGEPSIRARGLVAYRGTGQVQGGCLYHGDQRTVGILDLFASEPMVTRHLLIGLADRHPKAEITYINIASDDPQLTMFKQSGFTEVLSQHEMVLTL